MAVTPLAIAGALLIEFPTWSDDRGFFRQTWQFDELAAALGRDPRLRQGNHSRSHAGVLRGFHTEPWDKLIFVPRGTALCVVADTRPDSATFGRTDSALLGDAPGAPARLFVSRGLSNAFFALTETDYVNEVSDEYTEAAHRGGVAWDDPDLAVEWPTARPILSDTDRRLPTLRELHPDATLG